MKIINRTPYLNTLIEVRDTPDIKVITGIRRSGKSMLLTAFVDWIRTNEPDANIIAIDFNDLDWQMKLPDKVALYSYVKNQHKDCAPNYLMIDEVQNCEQFEWAINGLHNSGLFRIYITGSNAFLLNNDLATLFTGRTFEIEVYPFSMKEFVEYFEIADKQEALDRYMLEGGMSGSYVYPQENRRRAYLKSVYQTLIVRDIRQKHHIRNQTLLTKITDFLMDNISNLSSLKGITRNLVAGGSKATDMSVGKYIEHLTSAFLFYRLRRYDVKGKMYLATQDKYYLCDHSFRYALLGTRNIDTGRVLENIVAIELLRRGYEVYAGVLYKKEIDFVAMRQSEKIYIQVSEDITDKKTFEREVAPLFQIKDAYPKILLARTRHFETDYEGVRIIDIADWLMNQ